MDTMRGNLYRKMIMEGETPMDAVDAEADEPMNLDNADMSNLDDTDDGMENDETSMDVATPIVQTTQIDIGGFGTDTSDIHNEYDPKEVERLNALIASENSAIGEYFTGAKETNVDILRRLYSDIGEEERFHSEQLIFAKSQLTGEKYIPRDPDVKKEFEELLAMGMDEETAMTTAVDKIGLRPSGDMIETSVEETLEECARICEDVEALEHNLYQEALLASICTNGMVNDLCARDQALSVLLESYYDMGPSAEVILEAVTSVADKPEKEVKVIENPLKVIFRWISNLMKIIKNLGHNLAIWATKMRDRRKDRWDWIERHGGIKSLFQKGVSFYFYRDDAKQSRFEFEPVKQYDMMLMHLVGLIVADIYKRGGNSSIKFDPNIQYTLPGDVQLRPCNTIAEGLEQIKMVNMSKTKVLVNTPEKEEYLSLVLFGYHESKVISGKKVETDKDGNTTTTHYAESANVYNLMKLALDDTTNCLARVETCVQQINAAQAQIKQDVYHESVQALEAVVKAFNMLTSAISHDMKVAMKLNNDLLTMTQNMDTEDNAGAPKIQNAIADKSREISKQKQLLNKANAEGKTNDAKKAQANIDKLTKEIQELEQKRVDWREAQKKQAK